MTGSTTTESRHLLLLRRLQLLQRQPISSLPPLFRVLCRQGAIVTVIVFVVRAAVVVTINVVAFVVGAVAVVAGVAFATVVAFVVVVLICLCLCDCCFCRGCCNWG